MGNTNIRVATLEDARFIQAIYEPYVLNTAITFEEVVPSVEEFQERIAKTLESFPYLVLEEGEEIVGYAYAGRLSQRVAFDWSTEVSIYISIDHQRKGFGKLLYTELEKQLLKLGYQNIYACVAVPEVEDEYLTNNSLSYHQYLGFKECGRFENCGCKFNRWYHIVWLQKHAATKIPTDRPKKFIGL